MYKIATVSSKDALPGRKTRVGRPRKSLRLSQASQDVDESRELGVSPAPSSLGFRPSIEHATDFSTTDAISPSAHEGSHKHGLDDSIEERSHGSVSVLENEIPQSTNDDLIDDSDIRAQIESESQSFEVVAETIIEGPNLSSKATPALNKQELDPTEENILTTLPQAFETAVVEVDQAPTSPVLATEEGHSSSVEERQQGPMLAMRGQLEALMSTLQSAALSRGEANELEDLFMDAKEMLYRARRRGRQSVDL